MFNKKILFSLSLLLVPASAQQNKNAERNLGITSTAKGCTIMSASRFRADRSLLNYGHEILECLIDPIDTDGIVGLTLPIRGTKWQIESLKKMVHDGVIIPGTSFLNYKLATLSRATS